MFKLIFFLAIIIASVNAEDYTIEVTNAAIFVNEETNNYLETTKTYGKIVDSFTWKQDVDENTLPIEVDIITYQLVNKERKAKTIKIPNLCSSYDDQSQQNLHEFTLFVLGDTSSCPIPKGTKVDVKKKYSYSYSTESTSYCEPSFSILTLTDKTKQIEMFSYRFEANVKGPSCNK